jgi:hypothetical protein
MGQHQKHFKSSATWADQAEFLAQAQLLRPYLPDEEYLPQFQPTLAGLLLFGKAAAIQRNIPFFETSTPTPVYIRYLRIYSASSLSTL